MCPGTELLKPDVRKYFIWRPPLYLSGVRHLIIWRPSHGFLSQGFFILWLSFTESLLVKENSLKVAYIEPLNPLEV